MSRKILFIFFISFLGITQSYSIEKENNPVEQVIPHEVGEYIYKSVSYVPATVRPNAFIGNFWKPEPEIIRQAFYNNLSWIFQSDRFDANPLSNNIQQKYINRLSHTPFFNPQTVIDLSDQILRDTIYNMVQREQQERAERLTSREQRNSYATDKVKLSPAEQKQLEDIFKLAFLAVPVVESYGVMHKKIEIKKTVNTKGEETITEIVKYDYQIRGSLHLININLKDNNPSNIFKTYSFNHSYRGSSMNTITAAAISSLCRNLKQRILSLPEFRLTAQVISSDYFHGLIEFQKNVNMGLNRKIEFYQTVKTKQGALTQEKIGYGFIKNSNDEGKKYDVYRIGGSYLPKGAIAKETGSGMKMDLYYYYMSNPIVSPGDTVIDPSDFNLDYEVFLTDVWPYNVYGISFSGVSSSFRQLYYSLSAEFGMATARGFVRHKVPTIVRDNSGGFKDSLLTYQQPIEKLLNFNFLFEIDKKMYFRKLFASIGGSFGVAVNPLLKGSGSSEDMSLLRNLDLFNSDDQYKPLVGNLFQIAPNLNLNASIGWSLNSHLSLSASLRYPLYNRPLSWRLTETEVEKSTYDFNNTTVEIEERVTKKNFKINGSLMKLEDLTFGFKLTFE